MLLASRSRIPTAPELVTLSEPAKSTRCIFETFDLRAEVSSPSFGASLYRCLTVNVTIACERELYKLDLVDATDRWEFPVVRRDRISSNEDTWITVKFVTKVPSRGLSRTFKFFAELVRQSLMESKNCQ